MSISAIRDEIKDVIENDVTYPDGIDVTVHDYERWAVTWEDILSKFKTTSGIYHAWIITRRSTDSQVIRYNKKGRAHIFSIQGFYGLNDSDASEKTFQDIVEAIHAEFDTNKTLNGSCETIYPTWGSMSGIPGFDIREISQRMFGNVLCHFADCRLCAVETISI